MLPDPEMRKFLANGTAETVHAALSPHRSQGMEIEAGEDGALTLRFNGQEQTIQAGQQLKLTVRTANTLMEEPTP